MDYPQDPPVEEGPAQGPKNNTTLLVLAWVVILGGVVTVIVGRQVPPEGDGSPFDSGKLVVQEMMGRYILGMKDILAIPLPEENKEKDGKRKENELDKVLAAFPAGDVQGKLCQVILEGEVVGFGAALERLKKMELNHPEEKRAHDILTRLHQDYAAGAASAPSVSQEDRTWLESRLGWFGRLALHPRPFDLNRGGLAAGIGGAAALKIEDKGRNAGARDEVLEQAENTLKAFGYGFGAICVGGLLGLLGLILVLVYALKGKLRHGLGERVPYWGIYGETFAVWLVVFVGGMLAVDLMFSELDILETSMISMPVSLVALVYPRWRGVSWDQLCRDIGWTAGEEPVLEPLCGIACYVMALPLMALGLFCFALSFMVQGGMGFLAASELPSHPIVEYLANNDPWNRFKIFFVACVLAPVVEETMFRGVFYRHVRDMTRNFEGRWSFVSSAFLVSFLFAAIHPQGWLAIPLLMAVAFGLTIAREWRGTVFPSMLAHGINNGLALLLAITAIGR